MAPVHVDGSYGEGGGQILRTALALSCVLGIPFEVENIRKARARPGLQPQHLAAVKAAARISNAAVEGAAITSTTLRFSPGPIEGGDYRIDIAETTGSAGSTSLVFQTILLPLLAAGRTSTVTLLGGTHVPWSPTFHYVQRLFLPLLRRLNIEVSLDLEQWGWYPRGGGRITARIEPCREIQGIMLREPGRLERITGVSAVANLPEEIAARQRNQALAVLASKAMSADIEIVQAPSLGKGTLLFLLARSGHGLAAFDSLGALGKRAETVADEAVHALLAHFGATGALDPHCADQLVPYLALAHGRSEFTTSRVTQHLLTNIWVVQRFLNVTIEVEGREGEPGTVRVSGMQAGKDFSVNVLHGIIRAPDKE